MKLQPQIEELKEHLNHYWIVNDSSKLFLSTNKVYGYPGIRPEIIFVLKGQLKYNYLGQTQTSHKSILASHIHSNFLFDSSALEQFIIVQFKPRSLSSLLPFTKFSSQQLMHNSLCYLEDVFGQKEVHFLENALRTQTIEQSAATLDDWFWKRLDKKHSGFVTEMICELEEHEGITTMLEKTGYSLSTLERHIKKETGLSPKSFLSLRKYKAVVEEIYKTQNYDWQYYVDKYGYFDQSHFIKTIKRYTGFTPSQLVKTPNLISFRPGFY